MKYTVELEIPDNKISFAEEFFKTVSFIKKVRVVAHNEVTNPAILKSIDDYEKGKVIPTPFNLADLKAVIDA